VTTNRNVLALQCPHCGEKHIDDYECLEGGRPDEMRCAGCHEQFSFLIRECLECGDESVFTWKSMPAPETLALLSCIRCGAPFDEPAPEGQSPNPAERL
jgi:transcription elongation factor Elf1